MRLRREQPCSVGIEQRHVANGGIFSARLADPDDQDQVTLEGPTLQRVPILRAGEMQLPTGEGEDPPSQPSIDGLEPDLPTITHA